MGFQDIPFLFVAFLVQSYKWVELKIMQLFRSRLERKIQHTYAPLGVVFDIDSSSENSTNNNNNNAGTKKVFDEQYVKTKSEFDGVIHVKVHDKNFFTRTANSASLGMGETYMDGNWDCDNLTELFRRIMKKKIFLEYLNPWNRFLNYIHLSFFNLQTESKAWEVGKKHYDLGNDLFESFLDPWLTYSCGYWHGVNDLNSAQIQKYELIAKKLNLQPNNQPNSANIRILDIGCGWGGLCKFLAKNYGAEVVGVTISEENVKYARKSCEGLPVDIRLMDYRELNEKFDRIVSVGMMEHVGVHNHRTYFEVAHRCLKDDGIFLLHTIAINHKEMVPIEPWYHTYIFPNGCLPSARNITEKTEGLFIIEDWHNFGPDYAKTLHAWLDNFNKNWPNISHKYGDRFYRMWTYYLQSAAGGFESRMIQLWQIVLSKDGLNNYRAAR